jgi:hypothetical protein
LDVACCNDVRSGCRVELFVRSGPLHGGLDATTRTRWLVTPAFRGENLDIPVVDVNAYLCEATLCPAVRNGTLLYRDDSHLTLTAVRALLPAVEAQIREKGVDLSGH